jgi:hypothetical protein
MVETFFVLVDILDTFFVLENGIFS